MWLSGNEIRLQDLMLLGEQLLRRLEARDLGQPCGMRVLGGPLDVFLKI